MLAVQNSLISEDIIEKKFVCDLQACKGACCVEGDSGAPMEDDEIKKVEEVYEYAKPYMTREGIKTIEKEGFCVVDEDGDNTIPLVPGKKKYCSFTHFTKDGHAQCSIEKAYLDGKINFKKPVSCHLYPIRITKYKDYDALNYHQWNVCKPACKCGEKLKVPIYKFLREPLVRKYGEGWYDELEKMAKLWKPKQLKK